MKVYSLEWDTSHLSDMNYDIAIIGQTADAQDLRRKLMKPEKLRFDKTPEFLAHISSVSKIDFPVSGGFPVMSDRMIQALLDVTKFNVIEYPVMLVDDTFLDNRYENDGSLKATVKKSGSFSLVQTLEIFEGLDYSHSNFSPMQPGQLFPTVISKFVIREPQTGFPPLFRLIEKRSSLFVSEDARNALQKNKITGCVFKEYDVTPFASAV